jgi:hypothetical protein
VSGPRVSLSVDGILVLEEALPSPLQGDQGGLFAGGTAARKCLEIKDPYRRYDRLLYNVALHSGQQGSLVPKPPSKSFTLRIKYPDPDSAGRLSDHVSLPEVISSDRMSKSMLPLPSFADA